MGKHISKQLAIGGMYSAGDGGNNPDGTVRRLSNYLPRPNRMPSRPPFAYDSLMNVNGLAEFDDTTNEVSRLIAVDTSKHLFTKSATSGSETWGSANATAISGVRLSSWANYRGTMFLSFDDGSGAPSGIASYDGTTILTDPFGVPPNYSITPRALTVFGERLMLSSPRLQISNHLSSLALTKPYDWSTWTKTNCASSIVTQGTPTTKTCRVTPSATTGAQAYAEPTSFVYLGHGSITWLQHLRSVSASYRMPFTMEVVVNNDWQGTTAFSLQAVIVDSNGNFQRCTTAGTSGGSAPAWNTTVGGTTSDGGTLVWTNDGSAVIARLEDWIPVADQSGQWFTYYLTATIPALGGQFAALWYRFKFGNTTEPTITIAPIEVSYRDGLSDGNLAKANYGAQVTWGDFKYAFFNVEGSSTATIDADEELWSEIGLPTILNSENRYSLRGVPGLATASAVLSNRKLTFKRSAFWQFQLTIDADNPLRLEKRFDGIGCLGSLAFDIFEDACYFIGEKDIYAYSVGDATPTPICGDGMREEIMNRASSSWVESQSTCNRPLLCIDQFQLVMWVYTQKGKLYAYDLRAKLWSGPHSVGDGIGIECMAWNRNTNNFYVAFDSATYGLSRMVYSSAAPDTIDNTATTYPVVKTIVFRPIELTDPMRYDAYCEGMQILYASSGGQAVTLSISDDQGASYANSVDYTPVAVSTNGDFVPMTLDVCESGPTTTLKLTATGNGGESAWALSPRATVSLEVMKGEYPVTNPTSGTANL